MKLWWKIASLWRKQYWSTWTQGLRQFPIWEWIVAPIEHLLCNPCHLQSKVLRWKVMWNIVAGMPLTSRADNIDLDRLIVRKLLQPIGVCMHAKQSSSPFGGLGNYRLKPMGGFSVHSQRQLSLPTVCWITVSTWRILFFFIVGVWSVERGDGEGGCFPIGMCKVLC